MVDFTKFTKHGRIVKGQIRRAVFGSKAILQIKREIIECHVRLCAEGTKVEEKVSDKLTVWMDVDTNNLQEVTEAQNWLAGCIDTLDRV